MQDENTSQPADSSTAGSVSEPGLSLGANPTADPSGAGQSSDDETILPTSVTAEPAATDAPASEPADIPTPPTDESGSQSAPNPVSGDLESIKTSALEELAPLVDELDQEPEERYRTLMMIIQSSDKQDLVKEAYEAAQKIEDKKAKAEALLNILNEINYFTGKSEKTEG